MSKPVFLYLFSRGANTYRRAAASRDVVALSATWEASSIESSDVEMTGDAERDQVKITLPLTDTFAADYVRNVPEDSCTVAIYRYEQGAGTSEIWWSGRVTLPETTDGKVTFACDPDSADSARSTLPRIYMRQCPHAVYFGECRLSKADFATAAVLSSVSGATVTLAALPSGVADGSLAGGMIASSDGTLRAIRSHSGTQLVLVRALAALSAQLADSDTACTVYPGCDGSPSACSGFANAANASGTNIENYGGFLWMLTGDSNPFGGSSAV